MGLFDNLLKAVENGSLEKTLSNSIDKLESNLEKAVDRAEQVTAKVEQKVHKGDPIVEEPKV